MFSKTLILAQVFSAVHVMLYAVTFGMEFEQGNRYKMAICGVMAILHMIVLIHLILSERKNKLEK